MPRRRRVPKSRSGPLMARELNLWSVGGRARLVEEFGDLDAARVEWERRRHLVTSNGMTRPEAWWVFDGPPHLADAPELPEDHGEALEALDAFDGERRRWLASSGLLDDADVSALSAESAAGPPFDAEARELLAVAARGNGRR